MLIDRTNSTFIARISSCDMIALTCVKMKTTIDSTLDYSLNYSLSSACATYCS